MRELAPHLMLLQEVNRSSSEILREAAGADWMVRAIDLRTQIPTTHPFAGAVLPSPAVGCPIPVVNGCSRVSGSPSGSCLSRHRQRKERRLSR